MLTRVVDICVVYAVIASITGTDYVFRGRKSFRGAGERKADVSAHGHVVDVPGHGRIA